MESDAEASADEVGDAAGGPEVGGEAVVGRLVGEPAEGFGLLPGAEEALAAVMGLAARTSVPAAW